MIDVEFRDRAIYLPDSETLVCADLHLGRDASSPVQVPLGEGRDLSNRIAALCDRYAPARVVVAGDVLHSFSSVPEEAAASFDRIRRVIENADSEVTITTGNHDAMLAGLWQGGVGTYRLGDEGVVVCHGHERPRSGANTYIVGHEHPAIEIEGTRYPCYLYGSGVYEGRDLLVLPAFTKLAAGVVINRMHSREFQSPLITEIDRLRPIVRDEDADETRWFPPLGEFRSLL